MDLRHQSGTIRDSHCSFLRAVAQCRADVPKFEGLRKRAAATRRCGADKWRIGRANVFCMAAYFIVRYVIFQGNLPI